MHISLSPNIERFLRLKVAEGLYDSLNEAINATLGLATMLIATFGYRNDIWKEKIGRIIEVKKEPLWPLKDFFIPPTRESKLLEVKHPYIMSKWIEYKKTIDEKKQNDKYKTY